MIPVAAKPEPADFDAKVRGKAAAFFSKKGWPQGGPLPPGAELPNYWVNCLPELYEAYGGICAYLGIHFEQVLGAGSTDHFVAKSSDRTLAYEWANYRLACSRMNSRKRDFEDVLDPFYLAPDLFRLELSSGRIYVNPNLAVQAQRIVELTILRLGLDDALCREMRSRRFQEFAESQVTDIFLQRHSPFVWIEARRQGIL